MIFAPQYRPRITIASDGTLAAIREPLWITIVELPGASVIAAIDIDRTASACESAWVGTPPRLIVLNRFAGHSTVQVIEPQHHAVRTIAEIRLEAPMRLHATVGSYALAVGALGAAVLATGDTHLTPYQFPTRTFPITAGGAGAQFVVALSGSIEEWDPASRMPKRRLRLPRPANITAIGGSDRVVWMTTQHEPKRIDVIPFINRGQPKAWDLPESIAQVSGHPNSDVLAVIGAETGKIYLIDLDGRTQLRTLRVEPIERAEAVGLVIGPKDHEPYVIAAQAGRPIVAVSLHGGPLKRVVAVAAPLPAPDTIDDEAAAPKPSTLGDEPLSSIFEPTSPKAPPPARVASPAPPLSAAEQRDPEPVGRASVAQDVTLRMRPIRTALPEVHGAGTEAHPTVRAGPGNSLTDRFAARRDRLQQDDSLLAAIPLTAADQQPRDAAALVTPASRPVEVAPTPASCSPEVVAAVTSPDPVVLPPSARDSRAAWRDEVVVWARAIAANRVEPTPSAPAIAALVDRLGLPDHLQPAVMLAYGLHLGGELGAAPVALARVFEHRWHEVLGGELVARGIVEHVGSRARLVRSILRVLDDLPPVGTMVGTPGVVALLGPCVAIASDVELVTVAARCLIQIGGAIVVGEAGGSARDLLVEARARGAVPIVRADALAKIPIEPVILVVPDEATAATLDLPRL